MTFSDNCAIKTIINQISNSWRSSKVDEALVKAQQGDATALATIAKNLDVEMDNEPDFATQIKAIAHEINIGKIQDNSSMEQNIYDNARGWQTKVEGGTAYIGEIHINQQKDSEGV